MKKIKDRMTLAIVSGIAGSILQNASDELFGAKKISQRPYRVTAAGVWLKNKKSASSTYGQVLGVSMNAGLGMLGALGQIFLLGKTGKNHLLAKGTYFGVSFGALINGLLSGFYSNKIQPKDAKSNLSYMLSNMLYGLGTTYTAVLLGDESLWDTPPANDYLRPTSKTTEEIKISSSNKAAPVQAEKFLGGKL